MSDEQLDRRAMLEAAMEAAEEGTLEAPEEVEIETAPTDSIAEEQMAEKPRNEKGQFTKQEEQQDDEDTSIEAGAPEEAVEEQVEEPEYKRPTTWKKEYKEIWDKMEAGEQINKDDFVRFALYANQREAEYQRGVSTYRQEAESAKRYKEAIAPLIPDLERQGIAPEAVIGNLAKAHMVLSTAPLEQKAQMIQKLARDYGVELNSVGQIQQIDPYAQQLMSQLQTVNQEVNVIKSRFAQEENQRLMNEIEKYRSDVEKYPHFDQVREEMAQLLELGKAQDLETAYKKAVRMNDDVWSLEQERLLNDAKQKAIKAQQVAKAKSAAVLPKSTTPSGSVVSGEKKDRRALIAEQLGEATNRL